MDREKSLRAHLRKLLDWEDAHVGFEAAVEGIPPKSRGVVPEGDAHSLWQLLEHLRLAQRDILDFCRNPAYVEPSSMDAYWPAASAPASEVAWRESIAGFRRDLESLKDLAGDESLDLFSKIPHGTGQTYLRELLLVADHNAYHIGQVIAVRRRLGIWSR